ncbi:MAG: hypothetical protein J7M24_06445 [Candidatus Latescibacteria bacterium]|nr:hypothetical protein [Candidatus Latescibacterota bacterium]
MERIVPGALALLIIAAIASCSSEKSEEIKSTSGKTGTFTLVYSGNIGGKMRPCGCRIPLGGFARRSTAIDGIRNEVGDILVVDSGAMLYPSKYLYPPYDAIWSRIAYEVVDIVNDIGIDALNVSSYDVANSPDTLLAFDAKYPAQWLSANIVWKDSGELVFPPDMVKQVGDFKVGVFGFMDGKSLGVDIFEEDDPVRVLDPLETVRKEVAALRGRQCDIIVALAYMDFQDVLDMLETVDGINVAVVSHTHEHTPSSDHVHFQPKKVGRTIAVRCPDGGRVIGRIDLDIVNGDTDFMNSEDYIDLRPMAVRKKDPSPQQSLYTHTFIDLVPDVEGNQEIRTRINAFAKKIMDDALKQGIEYKVQ